MTFNSPSYFIFLPAVLLLYLAAPQRLRWALLLVASFVFYGFLLQPLLLGALLAVILISYCCGRTLGEATLPARRRRLLWVGVWGNLCVLIGMKYLPFLAENLNLVVKGAGAVCPLPVPPVLASIGVSFFAFQGISYLADLYFRTAQPEAHLGYFALEIAFFPKLLLGPLERSANLLPQLKKTFAFNQDNLRSGLLLFAWGLYKKIAVADRLAQFVDPVYANVHAYGGLTLLVAAYAYALQLYCDFSGYSDMALGSARLFNIELTQNFNAPFLSRSIAEFWRRWHVSFSRWIFDYIFEPLHMRLRNGEKWGTAGALLVTFVLAGVWHGANWTFVIFGAIHGFYLAASVVLKPYRKKARKALRIGETPLAAVWQTAVTFNLVCIPWVFFRAQSVADADYLLSHLFCAGKGLNALLAPSGSYRELLLSILALLILAAVHVARGRFPGLDSLAGKPLWFRLAVYYGLIVLLALLRVTDGPQFIYLNF